MENNLISGLYCKKGNVEWKPVTIGINVETFAKELIRLKDIAAENRGFLNVDICVSKDGQKHYAVLNDFKPVPQDSVSAAKHSPDREESKVDLPF